MDDLTRPFQWPREMSEIREQKAATFKPGYTNYNHWDTIYLVYALMLHREQYKHLASLA